MKFLLILTIFLSLNLFGQSKKDKFKELVIPAVENVYTQLQENFIEVKHYIEHPNPYYQKMIDKLKKEYKATSNEDLLQRMKPHPKSIAIAQAALESAWATSRFYREANNLFGVWSKNKNDARIAAGKKRGTQTIWLRKYETIEESIKDYYKTIARSKAFKEFRKLKMKTDNPHTLVKKLDKYSEIGAEYGKSLSSVINYNKFYLYDK